MALVCVCVGVVGDSLYSTFSGIKLHFKSYVLFNLNKTLFCHAAHLMYHCIYSCPALCGHVHTLLFMCTHKKVLSDTVCV